ncbi:hypothetical protein JKP88DRAFT_303023 [Tribonema minus]|uniref:UDENN domain-containing protein n=1 Tax=Tribonema minus TaxID=303371 RepID=A0A836CKZ6_9STRA|nr:hypothetical protein JKP88DRAFT_303023 [Tribonema minus]
MALRRVRNIKAHNQAPVELRAAAAASSAQPACARCSRSAPPALMSGRSVPRTPSTGTAVARCSSRLHTASAAQCSAGSRPLAAAAAAAAAPSCAQAPRAFGSAKPESALTAQRDCASLLLRGAVLLPRCACVSSYEAVRSGLLQQVHHDRGHAALPTVVTALVSSEAIHIARHIVRRPPPPTRHPPPFPLATFRMRDVIPCWLQQMAQVPLYGPRFCMRQLAHNQHEAYGANHLSLNTMIDKELLKLMREGPNRRCCDCDAELTDLRNIWASVKIGCFVCVNCKQVHELLEPPLPCKSVYMDAWLDDELETVKAMGNVRANECFERYVPPAWTKPTPDAEHSAIEAWIRAKYEKRRFMVPHYKEASARCAALRRLRGRSAGHGEGHSGGQGPGRVSQRAAAATGALLQRQRCCTEGSSAMTRPANMSNTLPIRLVDYFVVVGMGALQIDPRAPPTPYSSPKEIAFRGEVLDCFPEADSHAGCPLPEHIGQFAFPEGLTLSAAQAAPTMFHFVLTNVSGVKAPPTVFHFVLTNVSGVKMYGVALHVHEEVDREQLGQAIGEGVSTYAQQCSSTDVRPVQLPGWLTDRSAAPLHCPKALLLLSHYPFYTVYGQFLQQLYRISLSEAPVPIERYISNFVCEVPLPPQGQVHVQYALPDRTLLLKRPPKNRLPLVDFSYRPLFTCLSVDNVIAVFGCLLTEAKVVLCSSHFALLNPVAEALLSLLFPFVWQGAYIPVMPSAMTAMLEGRLHTRHAQEVCVYIMCVRGAYIPVMLSAMTAMLEAPVPFLVGINAEYLRDLPADQRPLGVVFVDLDNDVVHLGLDEEKSRPNYPVPRRIPHMPDRETAKLRLKLQGSAAVVHRSSIATAACAATAANATSPGSVAAGAAGGGGGGGAAGAAGGGSSAAAMAEAAAAALRALEKSHSAKDAGFKARMQSLRPRKSPRPQPGALPSPQGYVDTKFLSLTDARNNSDAADVLGFNVHEIRAAFLRFFVSIFRTYQDYLVVPTPQDPFPKELFDREAFLKEMPAQAQEFMSVFLQSQMFERFLEEQLSHPDQPEIRFFEESIVQKLNRGKKIIKKDTPFLNNLGDDHTQVFSPPHPNTECYVKRLCRQVSAVLAARNLETRARAPSRMYSCRCHACAPNVTNGAYNATATNAGLPDDGRLYTYHAFPRLRADRFGKMRWAQRLCKVPDQVRVVSSANQQQMISLGRRVRRTLKKRDAGAAGPPPPDAAAPHDAAASTAAVLSGIAAAQRLWRAHRAYREELERREAGAVVARALRRRLDTKADRARLLWVVSQCAETLTSLRGDARSDATQAVAIQRAWRARQRRAREALFLDWIITVQAKRRMQTQRRLFLRQREAAIKIQAQARCRQCRVAYLIVRQMIVLCQAVVRGWFKRRVARRERARRLGGLRAHVFELWRRAHAPLLHRSKFWVLFQGEGLLDLAVHERLNYVYVCTSSVLRLYCVCAAAQDEALRLWRDLGLIEQDKEFLTRMKFAHTYRAAQEWLARTAAAAPPAISAASAALAPTSPSEANLNDTNSPSSKAPPPPPPPALFCSDPTPHPFEPPATATAAARPLETCPDCCSRCRNRSAAAAAPSKSAAASAPQRQRRGSRSSSGGGGGGSAVRGSGGAAAAVSASCRRRRQWQQRQQWLHGPGPHTTGAGAAVAAEGLDAGAEAVHGDPANSGKGAAERRRLEEEREALYLELKRDRGGAAAADGARAGLFCQFGLEKQKKRKRKLVNVLWEALPMANASADAVLALTAALDREQADARGVWVRARRDARIRADLLCTVQACLTSIQVSSAAAAPPPPCAIAAAPSMLIGARQYACNVQALKSDDDRKRLYHQRAAAMRVLATSAAAGTGASRASFIASSDSTTVAAGGSSGSGGAGFGSPPRAAALLREKHGGGAAAAAAEACEHQSRGSSTSQSDGA